MTAAEQELRQRLCDAEQGHVFRFWDELTPEEHITLEAQLRAIDLDQLNLLIERHLASDKPTGLPEVSSPEIFAAFGEDQGEILGARRELGEEALARGRIATLCVAGGQATRMDNDIPKGALEITPITRKPLFALHAEKVRALESRHGVEIPLIVLVSPHNRPATEKCFKQHENFGLDPDRVWFCEQGMLPALDRDGRLLLADHGRIFLSPDGHGGVFRALARSGTLDKMAERRIDTLFYFHVDNPLVKIGDPEFLGHHLHGGADISLKVVRKRDPSERVGLYALLDGKPGVIEYSDLPEDLRDARDENGELCYWAGNIGIHIIDVAFARKIAEGVVELPFHVARKKVPHVNDRGQKVVPNDLNGLKFESFVFDALPFADKVVAVEVDRAEEFTPVKSQSGEDSLEDAIRGQSNLFRSWLEYAGIPLRSEESLVEIGPLFALDRQEFRRKIREGGLHGARRVLFE